MAPINKKTQARIRNLQIANQISIKIEEES